jgi:hypothetical protein
MNIFRYLPDSIDMPLLGGTYEVIGSRLYTTSDLGGMTTIREIAFDGNELTFRHLDDVGVSNRLVRVAD